MPESPGLEFDVPALFKALESQRELHPDGQLEWAFLFRSDSPDKLKSIQAAIPDEFESMLQEQFEEADTDGNVIDDSPLMTAWVEGELQQSQVTDYAATMTSIAKANNATYLGATFLFTGDAEDDLFGWFAADEVADRVGALLSIGIEPEAELPWSFLILCDSLDGNHKIAKALGDAGLSDHDFYDEPDADGEFGICAYMTGLCDASKLSQKCDQVKSIAESNRGRLDGVQFFTREDLADLGDD